MRSYRTMARSALVGAAAAALSMLPAGCARATRSPAAPESGDIGALRLAEWEPRSTLVTRETKVDRPAFPAIDVHNHLDRDRYRGMAVADILRIMDEAGVKAVVNLDGGFGEHLTAQLDKFDRAHPGRFFTFAQIDWRGIDEEAWAARATAQLERDFQAGAKGLKIHKELGLGVRYEKTGKLVRVDDPRLDPLWALCGTRKKPVMIHTADPAAFFTPLDRHNERWHELRDYPGWLFVGKDYPTRQELHAMRNRVIEKHPDTTFIGAHMAESPEDLATLGQWLDRYPNLVVDIDARISELGRQPYSARRFFLTYRDRILFGTDTFPSTATYRTYYRFLETDDEYFDPGKGFNVQGFWMVYGLYLPGDVLEKIYWQNAARTLGLP